MKWRHSTPPKFLNMNFVGRRHTRAYNFVRWADRCRAMWFVQKGRGCPDRMVENLYLNIRSEFRQYTSTSRSAGSCLCVLMQLPQRPVRTSFHSCFATRSSPLHPFNRTQTPTMIFYSVVCSRRSTRSCAVFSRQLQVIPLISLGDNAFPNIRSKNSKMLYVHER